jgi:chromosomal replication initiation ATPase DnaA
MTAGLHKARRPLADIVSELDARELLATFTEIAKKHTVTLAEMLGPRRQAGMCEARFECWALLRGEGWSWHRIADLFGRDHTTVMAGVREHLRRACRGAA